MSTDRQHHPVSQPHSSGARDDDMVAFGPYQLFPRLRLLLKNGQRLELGERALDVLVLLVSAAGQAVSKDTLLTQIWSKADVEENSLQAQISSLRKALGADRNLITTEFGWGYRFTGLVQSHPAITSMMSRQQTGGALPRPRSPLIGRRHELQELNRLLATETLLTIVGPAGIGKTRLAIEVASEACAFFHAGVYFADLSQLGSAASVSDAITSALAGRTHTDAPSNLPSAKALLLIDNCEHVASSCAQAIAQIMQADHNLSVLLTSQIPLGLSHEQVYRIGPLSVPASPVSAAKAKSYGAIELFVRRVTAADYHFELTENKVEPISALCRALDGVPLALEIAAARVPSLGLAQVTEDLAHTSGLLSAHQFQSQGRHKTLGQALQWSYQLLSAAEQTAFQTLAVFPGDFTLADAQQLIPSQASGTPRLIDTIYDLVQKSLISLQAGTSPVRYRYLNMLRTYALTQLGKQQSAIMQQHAQFVAELTAQAKQAWMTLPSTVWQRQYAYHIDNIRAALLWAFADQQHRPLGLRILANSAPFWIQLSLHDECRQKMTDVLTDTRYPALQADQEMSIQAALATALTWSRGPVPDNGLAWSRTQALAQQLQDREMQLQAEYGLWLFHLRSGRYTHALQHGKHMAGLAQTYDDHAALLTARRLIGTAHHFLGNHEHAIIEIETMLDGDARDERLGTRFRFGLDQRVAGWAFLSRILWLMGKTGKAKRAAQIAVDEAMSLEHACSLCCALAEGSCTIAAFSGDAQEVARISRQLQQVAADHGLKFWGRYGAVFSLWANMQLSPDTVGLAQLEQTLEKMQAHGFSPAYSIFLTDFAHAMLEHGDAKAASRLISTRPTKTTAQKQQWNAPELMRIQSKLLLLQPNKQAQAAALMQQALILARTQQAAAWEDKLRP